jgi:aspartate racemase
MPREVFLHTKKICKKNSKIGLLATEGTLKTKIYEKLFKNEYKIIIPTNNLQIKSVNRTIKHVKMGNIKLAEKSIKTAIDYLIKNNCKKIILGCTELPIAIFAFKSLKNVKMSKLYLDPNLILANSSMTKYKK